ncbi:type II secretion system major pseudopilin GspG [Spirochaetota bacterium]
MKKYKAFSLVEILIAIVILSTIALLIIPRLAGKTEKARRAAALMDIESGLASALDEYEADNGRYPTSPQGLAALISRPTKSPIPNNWQGPYLKKKRYIDPWGHEYVYRSPGAHNRDSYDLSSYAADGMPGGMDIDADINNWE